MNGVDGGAPTDEAVPDPPAQSAGPTISLVHATYHRPGGPLELRNIWLSRADDPSTIEYVVGLDADDHDALASTVECRRVVGPESQQVTAVRNWNAAAALATGDLLFVIADDLLPPPGWDSELRRCVQLVDPQRYAYAVKIFDSPDYGLTLMRHPIVSRAFYERLGLFDPRYAGVYCDDDLTTRAFWRAGILDGRSLVMEHRHPTQVDATWTASHQRVNDDSEYARGAALYRSSWTRWRRLCRIRLIRIPDGLPVNDRTWKLTCSAYRARASFFYPFREVRKAVATGLDRWPGAKQYARRVSPF